MATQPTHYLTVDEYLEKEDRALDRHEYLNGEMFQMPGGTLEHSTIGTKILASLHSQLLQTPYLVLGPDTRIRTSATGLHTYADVSVCCGQTQVEKTALLNPVLIIEASSDSTGNYDRGTKFEMYRQIESLSEYLIVAQDQIYVERHTKSDSEDVEHEDFRRCERRDSARFCSGNAHDSGLPSFRTWKSSAFKSSTGFPVFVITETGTITS